METHFWMVPPGATPPTPQLTLYAHGVNILETGEGFSKERPLLLFGTACPGLNIDRVYPYFVLFSVNSWFQVLAVSERNH